MNTEELPSLGGSVEQSPRKPFLTASSQLQGYHLATPQAATPQSLQIMTDKQKVLLAQAGGGKSWENKQEVPHQPPALSEYFRSGYSLSHRMSLRTGCVKKAFT